MTKIKFCGLCRPDDARFAETLGATFGGVILTESRRKVSITEARAILDAAPKLKRVGVVGRDSVKQILDGAREAELDVLQIHGRFGHDEITRLREEFEGDLWTVIGVDVKSGEIEASWRDLADSSDALLLDTSVRGHTGGTGKTFRWAHVAGTVHEIVRELPIVLAGGLTPDNVGDAIRTLHPWVVDVSSGVESEPRRKSHEAMSAFANAVRSASIV